MRLLRYSSFSLYECVPSLDGLTKSIKRPYLIWSIRTKSKVKRGITMHAIRCYALEFDSAPVRSRSGSLCPVLTVKAIVAAVGAYSALVESRLGMLLEGTLLEKRWLDLGCETIGWILFKIKGFSAWVAMGIELVLHTPLIFIRWLALRGSSGCAEDVLFSYSMNLAEFTM